jgi:hypothetical protein
MRASPWWIVSNAVALLAFAAAVLAYVSALPPSVSGGMSRAGFVAPRLLAFAAILGLFNLGLIVVGRPSPRDSYWLTLGAVLLGVLLMAGALTSLGILILFSFPPY